ncbi:MULTISPECIES: O-linked N-acetylglucosamine transferase, SPINDLY family protein [Trichocoleus]|uniref:O-linked N-acetylglucosamine transferase, SPINDLY family protein n=1 Tax=Trichocoleus desertorum GB2-A4 TaxID=2933944 RepID=A0ABV0JDI1_9CYAN|nr:O-linked N-acetylglucosamine transferase, SPINDLY family protein [Trichocoleus sp. FACHB-46]MBD1861233.1 O-linked N-acetylglucosamine transferase, SPINDLY family protein [Trichocoleus sp. FACHB-46]
MISEFSADNLRELQQQADQCLAQGQYSKAAALYEEAIEGDPNVKRNYWYLGLALLLQGQEAEAQTTWFVALADVDEQALPACSAELVAVLQSEAEKRESLFSQEEDAIALAIRHHLREILPADINNLLKILQISAQLNILSGDDLDSLHIITLLRRNDAQDISSPLLRSTLQSVLEADPLHPAALEFAEVCLPYVEDQEAWLGVLIIPAIKIAYSLGKVGVAICLAQLGLTIDPNHLGALGHLSAFYYKAGDYEKGIEVAKQYYSIAQTLPGKVYGSFLLLKSLTISGGAWEEADATMQHHKNLLRSLIEKNPTNLDRGTALSMFTSTFFLPYMEDEPENNRHFFNHIAELCQASIHHYSKGQAEHYKQHHSMVLKTTTESTKSLKVGYVSGFLRQHSVGWLARWLFQHHDRERFQIYTYFVNQPQEETFANRWFVNNSSQARFLGIDGLEIADAVYQDQIDILVDLDSITLDTTCEVMALKPAPIQTTWLGWDASGIPAIDYYIADPYVLPESAQNYYNEKIWRLPNTYIAVDGFEIGVPTLRRDHLDIPSDAVVYLSAQKGHKRHPDLARLQMKILKEVPNSYFLLKGLANEEVLKESFIQLAEAEGISSDRLRFLPTVISETVHRANLSIADVVLDTYPYNGATTTLETLWMGIPLVTRVGEQFVSRNSYTMLMNIGVTEGIASTAEEYVEWGVRFGQDPALRQQVAWKMRASRQISPLWNAKQFTQNMENAYLQMWATYLETK